MRVYSCHTHVARETDQFESSVFVVCVELLKTFVLSSRKCEYLNELSRRPAYLRCEATLRSARLVRTAIHRCAVIYVPAYT